VNRYPLDELMIKLGYVDKGGFLIHPESLARAEAFVDSGDLEQAIAELEGAAAPVLVDEWWRAQNITTAQIATVLLTLWHRAEKPCQVLPRETWLQWFRAAGYRSDRGRPAPTQPFEVYRGQSGDEPGLSWTTDHATAEYFRHKYFGDRILTRQVQPSAVLALIDGYNEYEVVIDPTVRPVRDG
jgi:hypothetical protein